MGQHHPRNVEVGVDVDVDLDVEVHPVAHWSRHETAPSLSPPTALSRVPVSKHTPDVVSGRDFDEYEMDGEERETYVTDTVARTRPLPSRT